MRVVQRFLAVFIITSLIIITLPSSGSANEIPPSAILQGVPAHPQTYNLSCESRSAADWAGYYGVYVSETDFLNSLPVSDNPDAGFVGSPHGVWGNIPPAAYGVHAGPVAEVLRQYGLPARASSGLSWDDLRSEIASGDPVIVWIIGAMWYGTSLEYTTESGDTVLVARYEHTMILYGYDEWYAYVIDSYSGAAYIYSISTFLNSWSVLGNTAVIADSDKPDSSAAPTPFPTPEFSPNYRLWFPLVQTQPNTSTPATVPVPPSNSAPLTYTVRQGDFLIQIARTYDLDWQYLAEINQIPYPYVVYPGQELKLR